jgi:hypothetical protein
MLPAALVRPGRDALGPFVQMDEALVAAKAARSLMPAHQPRTARLKHPRQPQR